MIMSNSKIDIKIGNNALCTLLTVMFVYLKLTGQIAWSWWWVLSPLWIPICIAMIIVVPIAIVAMKKGVKPYIRRYK
jgi:hypothetical protein